jgi:gamma-glutamyltranspeptidase/glutathione hydrolase
MSAIRTRAVVITISALTCLCLLPGAQADTQKPVLHGKHWVAITGKPLAATAGAQMFMNGGNAVDAACAMLAATSTMWDVLGWGGETQALIYNPQTKEVLGINALGVAPTGATPGFFRDKGLDYPPEFGPLAAVTPGTPGGLMVMLAEYGSLSLAEVLAPAIEMAEGYPIEASAVRAIERHRDRILEWPYSTAVFLPHDDDGPRGPSVGEIFRQPDLKATLEKLVETEPRRPVHDGRPGRMAGSHREARIDKLPRHRRLQADNLDAGTGIAADAEHPRELRRGRHGLQLDALHTHALPGHEPGLRGSRFLLR